jgi:hypothetical protein
MEKDGFKHIEMTEKIETKSFKCITCQRNFYNKKGLSAHKRQVV